MHVVVGGVADSMVGETSLPDRELQLPLFPDGVRGAALDQLNGAL